MHARIGISLANPLIMSYTFSMRGCISRLLILLLCLAFFIGCASAAEIFEKDKSVGEQIAGMMEEINLKAKSKVLAQELPLSAIISDKNRLILDSAGNIPAMPYKLEQWRLRSVEGLHSLVDSVSVSMSKLIQEFDTEELIFTFGDGSPLTDYIVDHKGSSFRYQVTELCRKYFYDTGMNVAWDKIVSDYNAFEMANCNLNGEEPQLVRYSSQDMIEWIGWFYTNLWISQMRIAEMGGR